MLREPRAVEHGPRPLGPLLETAEGLLDVPRLDGPLPLAGGVEEPLLELPLLGAGVVAAALGAGDVLLLLDLEGDLGEDLHHLEGQEAKDVDDIVRGLAVRHDAEAGPLPEPLALAVGEGGLAVLGPGDVLVLGHDLGALVGAAEALEGDEVHLVLILVLLVLALGDLDGVEGGLLPGEADLGLLVLLGLVVHGAADDAADRVVATGDVSFGAFVVRVLDVLAHVLPGEKGPEARDLGLVMADLEDEIVDADGLGSAAGSKLCAGSEL